ncbi:MAG: sensor histidine kinase, partial [Nitrospinota bacterium]
PLVYDVFQNLVTNAIKYSPEGTKIKIEIKECPDVWKIQVVDEGEGIADAHKQTVFNRFQRLNKGGVKGTGLGLAISKKIVDAHGGRIFVEDNEPEGSIFVVELPRYSEKNAL